MTDYIAALDFANEVRRELGVGPISELPPGIPGHGGECPLARGISLWLPKDDYVSVGAGSTYVSDYPHTSGRHWLHPERVSQFVRAFDEHPSRELEARDPDHPYLPRSFYDYLV